MAGQGELRINRIEQTMIRLEDGLLSFQLESRERMRHLDRILEDTQRENRERADRADERMDRLDDAIHGLIQHSRRTDEAIQALTEQTSHTDERLNALIAVVDQIVRDRRQ
jgi:seryl-tRNA synthetase